jgi:hypothetical protein
VRVGSGVGVGVGFGVIVGIGVGGSVGFGVGVGVGVEFETGVGVGVIVGVGVGMKVGTAVGFAGGPDPPPLPLPWLAASAARPPKSARIPTSQPAPPRPLEACAGEGMAAATTSAFGHFKAANCATTSGSAASCTLPSVATTVA